MHDILFNIEIHSIFFDLIPYIKYIDYKNIPYSNILSLVRDHIINYFDQISIDKRFDKILNEYEKEQRKQEIKQEIFKRQYGLMSLAKNQNKSDKLPFFWQFIISIILNISFLNKNNNNNHENDKKTNNDDDDNDNYDDMESDAQAGCIRLLTRWIRRRLPDDEKNKDDDDDDDDKEKKKNDKNVACDTDNEIIDLLLIRHYNHLFKYIKYTIIIKTIYNLCKIKYKK